MVSRAEVVSSPERRVVGNRGICPAKRGVGLEGGGRGGWIMKKNDRIRRRVIEKGK